MNAEATELYFRTMRDRGDYERMRNASTVSKYKRFLMMMDALRSKPDRWFDVHDIARVTGFSLRHSRRWISLMFAMQYPGIEVEYGKPVSRMRFIKGAT